MNTALQEVVAKTKLKIQSGWEPTAEDFIQLIIDHYPTEKQQMEDAVNACCGIDTGTSEFESFSDYYNKTYNGDEK